MNYDVVVVGGGPSGIQAALSARIAYPDRTIALVRREEIALQIGALSHVLGSLGSLGESIFPDRFLTQRDIELIVGQVEGCQDSQLRLHDGRKVSYHKLILALGGRPEPLAVPGSDLPGVIEFTRDYDCLKRLGEALVSVRSVMLVGGGRTGVEITAELTRSGKEVTLVESKAHLLSGLVDPEFGQVIEDELIRIGATVITGYGVRAFAGRQSVLGADLADGRWVTADLVILAPPFRPATQLAEAMGLRVDPANGVIVDEYLRTSAPGIHAVGECAAARSFFATERQRTTLMSEAMAQARLAGSNLFTINVAKSYSGSLGSFSVKAGELVLGVTGLTELKAASLGLQCMVGLAETTDRHPPGISGANKVMVKLLFDRCSHHLVGAQVVGGESTGECVNMLAVMVQKKMTDMEIDTLQLGTHPLLTPSPLGYGVIAATVDAVRNWTPTERGLLVRPIAAASAATATPRKGRSDSAARSK